MKTYAVADQVPPECDYITEGKEYAVTFEWEGGRFNIILENGRPVTCKIKGCAHLHGGNWRRVER